MSAGQVRSQHQPSEEAKHGDSKSAAQAETPRLDPTAIDVAWTSFTTQGWDIRRGSRLRGDHAAVNTCPKFPTEPGRRDPARTHHRADHPPPDPGAKAAKIPEPIDDEPAVLISTTQFRVLATGRLISKGGVLRRDDPDVVAFPEYFVSAPTALL
jgi:hypothetical protein